MGQSLLVTEPCEQGRFSGVFHGVHSECGTPLLKKRRNGFSLELQGWAGALGSKGWRSLGLGKPLAHSPGCSGEGADATALSGTPEG